MANPSRGGVQGTPLSPLTLKLSYAAPGQGSAWFGPGAPMPPSAPSEVRGRAWDFPVGYNLNTTARAYEPVGFDMLRRLADGYDLLRLVIETRKDQVARMDWTIRPREGRAVNGRTAALITWLRKPDGLHRWDDWLRMALEDVLVIDALSLLKRRDYAGNLLALEPIDGATIKPLVDDWGRIPEPMLRAGETEWPDAYQQVLKDLPAVNYTANDLLYRPRNRRVNRVYGYSPVEQVMTTVNIALRRQVGTLEYYTSGNVPDSLIGVPDTWTPDQIAAFQNHWDSLFEGNQARRRKAKFVPGGVAKTFIQTREPELKGEFDEWLARVVCFAFSTSPQALLKQMNRASADTQKEIAEEEGLAPLLDWVKGLIDDVLADDFGAPELEFAWAEDVQIDEARQAEILRGKASSGLMSINEVRAKDGLDPDPSPAANQLMVLTGSGYVPIDANTLEGRQAAMALLGPPAGPDGAFGAQGGGQEQDGEDEVAKRLLAKFDPDQPRAADGKWTSGGGGSAGGDGPAKIRGEEARGTFRGVVRNTTIAAALLAGGAVVTAMSGGTAPAVVALATYAADSLLTNAAEKVARHLLSEAGVDAEAATGLVAGALDSAGLGGLLKAESTGIVSDLRRELAATVNAALDEMSRHVEEARGDFDEDVREAALAAIEERRRSWQDKVAAIGAPAEKAAGFTKRWGRPDPVPFDRPATRRAIRAITGRVAGALAGIRDEAVAAARGLGKLAKAAPNPEDTERARREADAFVDRLDLSDLDELAPGLADDLAGVATDTVRRTMAQVGADGLDTLVDQVNEGAVAEARARAAELVGMHWDEDGNLVEAKRASYRIDETTRESLRETIVSGLARNIGSDAIADEIEASYAFSAERALTIAETEVAAVNGQASLESYHAARHAGVGVKKAWWAENGCCAACQANAEAGPIDLDDEFPSGDETTPAHPKCRCVVAPVVEDGPEAVGKAFDPRQGRDERGRWTSGLSSALGAAGQKAAPVVRASLGPVTRAARIHALTGVDVRGFKHTLTNEGIRHILAKHGSAQERSRGQIPVSAGDFAQVTAIVRRPDTIGPGPASKANGQPRLIFTKAIDGVTYTCIGEIQRGKRRIEVVTLWKR
ncbi:MULTISPECIES: phage portal protein [Methylobacterium]|uniref:phage portal protein n=1 Tax=Methylobacterium TaxID=407 RepID=UPI0013ECC476|nr:phage portal protein [Methylobacterium sp. DB0501]NGM34509.1 phage portal protein [Methylobacterium sp. DB0501]